MGVKHVYLQRDELVVNHHVLGEEVGADGGLVLLRVPLGYVLVHQRRFSDAAVAQDDHLEQHFLAVRHGVY